MFQDQIIKELIYYRKKNSLNQDQFAKKIGVGTSTIARFETKKGSTGISVIEAIVKEMGLKIELKEG